MNPAGPRVSAAQLRGLHRGPAGGPLLPGRHGGAPCPDPCQHRRCRRGRERMAWPAGLRSLRLFPFRLGAPPHAARFSRTCFYGQQRQRPSEGKLALREANPQDHQVAPACHPGAGEADLQTEPCTCSPSCGPWALGGSTLSVCGWPARASSRKRLEREGATWLHWVGLMVPSSPGVSVQTSRSPAGLPTQG